LFAGQACLGDAEAADQVGELGGDFVDRLLAGGVVAGALRVEATIRAITPSARPSAASAIRTYD
jgi:hypothetical protein